MVNFCSSHHYRWLSYCSFSPKLQLRWEVWPRSWMNSIIVWPYKDRKTLFCPLQGQNILVFRFVYDWTRNEISVHEVIFVAFFSCWYWDYGKRNRSVWRRRLSPVVNPFPHPFNLNDCRSSWTPLKIRSKLRVTLFQLVLVAWFVVVAYFSSTNLIESHVFLVPRN